MIENPDKEVLAAEYVLGTLDAAERAQAQRLIASDPAFAAMVGDWERRLGELNVLVAPVEPPPAILERIKTRKASGDPVVEVLAPEPPAAEAVPPVEPPPIAALTAELPVAEPVAEPPVIESPTIEPAAPPPPPPPTAAAPARAAAPSAEIIDLSRRARRWRGGAIAIAALAAAFAGLVVVREMRPELMPDPLKPRVVEKEVVKIVEVPSPKPAPYVAVLQRDAASPAFLLTFDLERRTLTVRKVGAPRQAGKSYELWLVSDRFASPRSLGVIGNEEFTQRPQLANYDAVTINRATYAVSLEPEGGSPTGKPTGPVLYSGKLLQATPPSFAAPSP
jgi:anti-sigma-K factor RskA